MSRLAAFLVAAALLASLALPAQAGASVSCGDPGAKWERRLPSDAQMRGARLQQALDWTMAHKSVAVAVFRHGCLVGESRLHPLASALPIDGWSLTKSATSMVVGRAVTLGLLDIERPIGALYPEADAQHAALTPRHLLEMTAGLHRNWVRDLSPQPDRVRDALSLPFDHEPGTHWEYMQSTVTLLANVVERAVGKDFQDFAQAELFGPLGISRKSWSWERDRAGHTETWAHLHMRSRDWARLGHLMLREGSWHGRRLISEDYVRQALTPSETNHAYGFLFWLNRGDSYVLPSVHGPDRGSGPLIPAAPRDTFLMAGMREQRVYVIPSRDMVIVRLGEPGSVEADTRVSVWSGRAGQLDHELIRRVMLAVTDVPYEDPGPYAGSDLNLPPPDDGIVGDAHDVPQVLAGVGGPHE